MGRTLSYLVLTWLPLSNGCTHPYFTQLAQKCHMNPSFTAYILLFEMKTECRQDFFNLFMDILEIKELIYHF